jgi:class 3 adenylate cyclase
VLHRAGDGYVSIDAGRFVAERIPDATFVELPGRDHFPYVPPTDELFDALRTFLALGDARVESSRRLATVLFTDIVGSTERAASLGDAGWKQLLDAHHTEVRSHLARHGGHEVDTAGDGFFATFDGPARAVRCAEAIIEGLGELGLPVRVGVHTGEVEVIGGKTGGIAVAIGSRVAALAGAAEILATQTVKDLTAGSGIRFDDRGAHVLKGVPEAWRLYAVEGDSTIS